MNKEQAIAKAKALEAIADEAKRAYWEAVDLQNDEETIERLNREWYDAREAWSIALRDTY
jgi:hypothetical protein|nr:MAG TPA: hypothetical protein [Caudoviricetes sp.]